MLPTARSASLPLPKALGCSHPPTHPPIPNSATPGQQKCINNRILVKTTLFQPS